MSEPVPFDEHAERLKIRSDPKPVTRINRKILIVGAGLGVLGLFAAASIALQPPKAASSSPGPELYNVENTRKPDGLSALPRSYSEVRPAPILGPPLAGDLGSTILRAERELGVETQYVAEPQSDFRPNPEQEAARAARMREAAMAEEAARAPVFFSLQAGANAAQQSVGRTQPGAPIGSELLALAAMPQAPAGFGASPDANLQDRFCQRATGSRHLQSSKY